MKKSKCFVALFLSLLLVFATSVLAFAETTEDVAPESITAQVVVEAEGETDATPSVAVPISPDALPPEAILEDNPVVYDSSITDISEIPGEVGEDSTSNFIEDNRGGLTANLRARSMFQFTTTLAQSGNATASNPNDMYFFSVNSNRDVYFKVASTNANAIIALYQMNWNTGALTMIGYASPNVIANVIFNTAWRNTYGNDYAFVVMTLDGSSAAYTAYANVTNPIGQVLYKNDTLSHITVCANGTVYTNGSDLLNSPLHWEREFTFNWDSNYSHWEQSVDMTPSDLGSLFLGEYVSTKYTIPNGSALIIKLNGGYFHHFNSTYTNDRGNVQHVMNWYDPSGRECPRSLSSSEAGYLIIDLRYNSVVDWANSALNYWYVGSGEKIITLSGTQIA